METCYTAKLSQSKGTTRLEKLLYQLLNKKRNFAVIRIYTVLEFSLISLRKRFGIFVWDLLILYNYYQCIVEGTDKTQLPVKRLRIR